MPCDRWCLVAGVGRLRNSLNDQGFTLIELMVTIALLTIIMLASLPLTSGWVHSAHTAEARSKLERAFGITKALAMRNPCNQIGGNQAARLTVKVGTETTVEVRSGCQATDDDATDPPVWKAALPSGVAVHLKGATNPITAKDSIALTNRGELVSPDEGSAFKLSKGSHSNDQTGRLY